VAVASNCNAAPISGVTLYLRPIEIRNWKATAESIFANPVPNIRLVYDATNTYATALRCSATHLAQSDLLLWRAKSKDA
jgi:hypothetical protein